VLLQDHVARQAEAQSRAVALVLGEVRMTYGELEAESSRLARMLEDSGCAPGDRVALCTPKTPAAVVGMLAALKAGCAYVPIDIATPAPRVALVLRSAEPRLVLAAPEATRLLDDLVSEGDLGADLRVGCLAEDALAGERVRSAFSAGDWATFSAEPLRPPVREDGIAHLLFTSGSTGIPKGVVITHRNALAFVAWAIGYFGTKPTDLVSGHPPLHFDLSTFDIYGTFAAGAQLHLVPAEASLNPRGLAAFIRDSALTQWFSVPSVLTFMAKFDAVAKDDFPALERLLWCGEVLPTPVLVHWMKRLPHVRFTNLYGPTEATIASSYYTVPERPADETQQIPIGTPCDGEELMVLDEDLRAVPPGEIGDLYIAGVGLSPGYWRDEEKTREVFLPDPRGSGRIYRTGDLARVGDDGLFYFLGRADSQIKSRGYRIELGEIETALNAVEGVRECAVVGVDTEGFEGTAICAAYSAVEGAELEPARLRAQLGKVLPSYMLPSKWMTLETLPKNVNGKIDRKELRGRFAEEAAASRPG
jgi:amino acid adenylation domain-containing protein